MKAAAPIRRTCRATVVSAWIALATVVPLRSLADPSYFVSATAFTTSDSAGPATTPQSITVSETRPLGLGNAIAGADAGAGSLGTSYAISSAAEETTTAEGGNAGATASFTIDDVVITGPPGSVQVAGVNLRVSGALSAGTSLAQGFPPSLNEAWAEVSVSGNVNGVTEAGLARLFVAGAGSPASGSIVTSYTASGIFSGLGTQTDATENTNGSWDFDETLTTQPFTVDTGVPFSLSLSLTSQGYALVPSLSGANASSVGSFKDGFGFAAGTPVFDLPPGYTANSPQGRIVDNVWIPPAPAVPLPAWAAALLASLLVVRGAGALAAKT